MKKCANHANKNVQQDSPKNTMNKIKQLIRNNKEEIQYMSV